MPSRLALTALILAATAAPVAGGDYVPIATVSDIRASMARVEHVLANTERSVIGFASQTAPHVEVAHRGSLPTVGAFTIQLPGAVPPECLPVILDRTVARMAIAQFNLVADVPIEHRDEAADELSRAVALAIWADDAGTAGCSQALYGLRGGL